MERIYSSFRDRLMITWLIQQCRLLYKFFVSNDSARQMAVAAAFGVLLGLVPKGNLLAVGLSCAFLSLRVHLATGAVVGLAATFLAGSLDTLFHNLGEAILSRPSFQALFAQLYELPFGPWTAFNNTIVCGSLVAGLVAFYPTYRLTLPLFERWHEWKSRGKVEEAVETEEEVDAVESVYYEEAVDSQAIVSETDDSGQLAERIDEPLDEPTSTALSRIVARTLANATLSKAILTKTKPNVGGPTVTPVVETPLSLSTPPPEPSLSLAKPPQDLRIDTPHTVPVRVSDNTPTSNVPQRRPKRPHYAPREVSQVAPDKHLSVRETLQRLRFKQFVAEVESISRRVA
jgi:uncharacterized protein (TIGR03546 family)